MTQSTVNQEWLDTIPAHTQRHMKNLDRLAKQALDSKSAYHSIRIANERLQAAGNDAGRVLGWAITRTSQHGWEYQHVIIDANGVMTVLFKNPYIFS